MERKKIKKEKRKIKQRKTKKKKIMHNMVVLSEKNVLVFAKKKLLKFFSYNPFSILTLFSRNIISAK